MPNVPTYQPTWRQNRARNASEARYPHLWKGVVLNLQPGLGPTGDVLHDLSGRGNNGTLENMEPATDWVNDEGRWALDLDGTDEYVDVGLPLNGALPMSVSAWFKADDTSARCIWSLADELSTNRRYLIVIDSFDNRIKVVHRDQTVGGFSIDGAVGPVITTGLWYHVVGNWASTTLREIYINGQFVANNTSDRAVLTTATRSWIGRQADSTPNWEFDGLLDDIVPRTQVMLPSEIQLLYQLGRGGWMAKRRRVFAKAPAAPSGGILVHPGMTGGIPVLTGGMRG